MQQNATIDINQNSSDEILRLACCRSDQKAQEYLYKRWFGELLGISLRYTGNREEAIDVLNDAFVKIFSSIKNYKQQSSGTFSGWLAKIVFNTTIDYVRKRTKYRKKFDFNSTVNQSTVNEALGNLAAEDIFKLVQKLAPSTRNVFSLFVLDGYNHSEIGKMLNIDKSTSRWHLGQARKTLRDLIKNSYLND